MDFAIVPVVIIAILMLLLIARSVVLVPAGMAYVVGSMGRAGRALTSGFHVIPPFVTSVVAKMPTSEQTIDIPAAAGHLRDGTAAGVHGAVRYRIANPVKAFNDVADYRQAVMGLASSHWLKALEQSDLNGWVDTLRAAVSPMRMAAAAWGIEIIDATPLIDLSEAGVKALEARAAAERRRLVLSWLSERGESPGADGAPTAAQYAAYKAWMEQEVEMSREDLEAAILEAPAQQNRGGAAERANARAVAALDGPPATVPQAVPSVTASSAKSTLRVAVARSTLAPGGTGRIEVDGRQWSARNTSTVAIQAGFRCVVEREDGDTLIVRAL